MIGMLSHLGSAPAHCPSSTKAGRRKYSYATSDYAIEHSADASQSILNLQHSSIGESCAKVPAIYQSCTLIPLEESSVSSGEISFSSQNKSLLTRTRSNRSFMDEGPTRNAPISIAVSTTSPHTDMRITPSKWFGKDINKYTDGTPNAPNFNPCLRKFIEGHVSKSRRMREDRWQKLLKKMGSNHYRRSALSICNNALIPYPSLRLERSFLFDVETYPLHQILADMIGVKDLSLLHQHEEKDKRILLGPLLDPDSRKAFHECYENFVTSICIPDIHSRAMSENIFNISSSTRNSDPQEICYRYQAFPCLRVMKPGEFSIGPHCDMAYGHSIGNINFHIPLTPTFGTNALYTETRPGREDWHPLTTKSHGLGYIFDGARCLHFSLENTTDRTRVSLDFRIAIYRKSARKSNHTERLYHSVRLQNHSMESPTEEDDVDDVLCSESVLEDNYSTVPGYYDECLLDVGRSQFSHGSVSRKNGRRGLLAPDKRVGFPF